MAINNDKIISEFKLIPFGSKGWLTNMNLECPDCKRSGKFGINMTKAPGGVHCFYCEYSENIYRFLNRIGRSDLISFEREVFLNTQLRMINEETEEEVEEIREVKLPRGFQMIDFDEYLHQRNFKDYQYEQFEVGVTNHFLERKLKNYLIFIIKQRGLRVGWVARSKHSYQWHKQNLEEYKNGISELVLRYRNSEGTDFDKLLGGFDEITPNTEEVIIVEGIFDKTNISNLLSTNDSERLKVLCSFGNKVSDEQVKLLRSTNVKITTLLYDFNTIKQSKTFSTELSKYFKSYVCSFPLMYDDNGDEIDPGNITDVKKLEEILSEKKNFLYFYNLISNQFKNQL